MNIIETPCRRCGLPIECGEVVILVKVAVDSYGTLHFMCPDERKRIREALHEICRTKEEFQDQLSGLKRKPNNKKERSQQSFIKRLKAAIHF